MTVPRGTFSALIKCRAIQMLRATGPDFALRAKEGVEGVAVTLGLRLVELGFHETGRLLGWSAWAPSSAAEGT